MKRLPVLYQVKDGRLKEWSEWCKSLETTHKAEALETLREEGVLYEFCVTFPMHGHHYVLGFVLPAEQLKPSDQTRELNQRHRDMKERCLDKVGPVAYSYYLHDAQYSQDVARSEVATFRAG